MEKEQNVNTHSVLSSTPLYEDDDVIIVDDVKVVTSLETVRFHRNVIAFCSKGKMVAEHNGMPTEVHEKQIFICSPVSQLTNVMISPDFEFLAMAISNNALQHYLREYISIWNQFAYVDKINVLMMESQYSLSQYEHILALIRLQLDSAVDAEETKYKHEMLKGSIHIILIGLCNLLRKQAQAKIEKPKQNVSYFNQFLDLLQRTEYKHQTVEYYAAELCISTKYLTEICKKNSDKTANQWIREYVLADITNYLLSSNLSMKEIAVKVGFTNTSFFGKFFKNSFGCTPMEYRRRKITN